MREGAILTNITLEEQDKLLETLRRLKADRQVLVEGAQIQKDRIEKLRGAMESACNELGVPTSEYPAPISNAYNILKKVLLEDHLRGLNGVS